MEVVVGPILVALNSGTVVIGVIPQLVGLEPIWGDPCDITSGDIKLAKMLCIFIIICCFILTPVQCK